MSIRGNPSEDQVPSGSGVLLIALFPALSLCLFGPVSIFLSNREEFDVSLTVLMPWLLGTGLVLALLMALPVLIVGSAWRRRLASMLFVLGVLLWAQAAFLMPEYGVLDGRGIDWQRFGLFSTLDLALWLGLLILALSMSGHLARSLTFAATVFIVLLSLPVVRALLDTPEDARQASVSELPDALARYSPDLNIVHLVFDNFQTDVFLDLVREKSFEDELDGFVLFPDNAAVAPHTALAVPAIFSGRVYDGEQSADNYYKQAIINGFHAELLEHDFVVNLTPLLSMRDGPASNYYELPQVYSGSDRDRIQRELAQLLDVSLFRQLPHVVRRWMYNDNNWRISQLAYDPAQGKAFQQRQFLTDYIDRISVSNGQPTYHYVHLWPPHPPFSTTSSGRSAGQVLPNTLENYRNEARPMVTLLVDLIEKLKAEGIYDQTAILFHSDHGGGFEPDFMPRRLMGLMAVKPLASQGSLKLSDRPTSVIDVAATILDQAGISAHGFPGRSMVEESAVSRIRPFRYLFEGKLHGVDISGSIHQAESFSEHRLIDRAARDRSYDYGTLVNAGMVGNGGRYLDYGWSNQDDRHVWSNGSEAGLEFLVTPPEYDLRFIADLIPNVDLDKLPEQRVIVQVNGAQVMEWTARQSGKQRLEADIPADLIESDVLQITFILPDAASPAEIGTGGDQRQLGVALVDFVLEEQTLTDSQ